MVKGSSISRLRARTEKALKKDPNDRTYKEIKDISNWRAVAERWEDMKGNDYAAGRVRTEETRKRMRLAQQKRRKRELLERLRKIRIRASSSDEN